MSGRLRSTRGLARPALDRVAAERRTTPARQKLEVVVREPDGAGPLDVRLADARPDRGEPRSGWEARVVVSTADGALRDAVAAAIAAALRGAAPIPEPTRRVLRVRTRKAALALGPHALRGAVVVVPVSEKNARRVPDIVEAVRAADPLGVQLVWNGVTPARAIAEPPILTALERARSAAGPPVVLAPDENIAFVLRFVLAQRSAPSSGAWSLEPDRAWSLEPEISGAPCRAARDRSRRRGR